LGKSKERMRANFDREARIFLCRNNGRSKVTIKQWFVQEKSSKYKHFGLKASRKTLNNYLRIGKINFVAIK
jgi:hypothetical protein